MLHQNYPNPFNPITTIDIDIPKTSFVSLKVYNNIGAEIKTLVIGNVNAGIHKVDFDASSLPSGVYYYRMLTDDYVQTRKMILIK
ncbi:MAG TPA: T9SS type A sorting domain-containing protein [Ignavibacteria bacterium]|nr:T9SS type A sorting domain-containing protein [Ignavibacteria bacterium]